MAELDAREHLVSRWQARATADTIDLDMDYVRPDPAFGLPEVIRAAT